MVVINMKNVGQLVGEGTYPVVLTRAVEKKNEKGVAVLFFSTIKDSGTEWDGRQLVRSFYFPNDADADISGTAYFLQQSLLAFGADEDDVVSEEMDPVVEAKKLYGNKATATVVHNVDKNDPDKKYANASFSAPDF